MFRTALVGSFVMFSLLSPANAQPAGLLGQAIEENNDAKDLSKSDDVKALVREADALAEQRKFNDAIKLYARAYKLAPGDQNNYLRLLIAKRAAGRMTEEDREALDLIRRQQASQVEQSLRTVRLDLVQARQALRAGDRDLAQQKANHASATLDAMPPDVDVTVYRNQLRKLGLGPAKVVRKAPVPADPAGEPAEPMHLDDRGQVEGEVEVEIDCEDGEVEIACEPGVHDMAQHEYDRHVAAALRQNRVNWFLTNNYAAIVPMSDMTFPADWLEKTAARSRYHGGVIYETAPFTGDDGETYTTAIYDLGDLVAPVPNFYAAYPGTAREQRNEDLDRAYLRERSYIFNGYPEDLAAGLPLLHFFGGIDNWAISTRTDPNQTARVLRTIEVFLNNSNPNVPK
jgi:tetratricopeptide (TPR) repeat protein